MQTLKETNVSKKRNYRQFFSLFLCVLLLPYIITGCGDHNPSEINQSDNATNPGDENTGMRRYTETILELPDDGVVTGQNDIGISDADAMKSEDDKIYALPCEIQLPILFGDQSVISQMNDLESIADTVESMKQKYPGQDLIGIYTADDILRLLTEVSTPSDNNEPALDSQPYDSEFLADSDGNLISIDIYQPNEESIAALCTCIEDADTPYITDQVLEAAIYEHGAAYLQGNISLEEALDAIEKKLTIYMTE